MLNLFETVGTVTRMTLKAFEDADGAPKQRLSVTLKTVNPENADKPATVTVSRWSEAGEPLTGIDGLEAIDAAMSPTGEGAWKAIAPVTVSVSAYATTGGGGRTYLNAESLAFEVGGEPVASGIAAALGS